VGTEGKQQVAADDYYEFGQFNGEVDYLEVDPEGMMSSESNTLLIPPGMRLKQYYQSV
jgi:hypothetical protein